MKKKVNFVGAQREHHGIYRCRVTNAAGQAQYIGHLRVRSEPSLKIQPQQSMYFLTRQPLSVSCLVSGYPLAGTNISALQGTSMEESAPSTETGDKTMIQNQQQKNSEILKDVELTLSVRLLILNANRRREPLVSVKLSDLRAGVYEGLVTIDNNLKIAKFSEFYNYK